MEALIIRGECHVVTHMFGRHCEYHVAQRFFGLSRSSVRFKQKREQAKMYPSECEFIVR